MKHFALLGHPVGHSLSPAIHHAAYAALGIEATYSVRDCPTHQAVVDALAELRSGALAGANVTVPHKRVALSLADQADPLAARAGAANVIVKQGDLLVAHNTDVLALLSELSDVPRGTALVIGNGGAALGALTALSELKFDRVVLSARRFVGDIASWPDVPQLEALGAEVVPWASDAWLDAATTAALIIQATSAGMSGASSGDAVSAVVPWNDVPARAVAYDVVYNPKETPFLRRALERGLDARGGLGMLVGQAAAALELWLDVDAPRAVMLAAAELGLLERGAANG